MTAFDPCRVFRKLAYNNALANRRLHGACAALAPGEFEATRASFFPSIRATLNHILIIDWFYVDALEGGLLGLKAFADEQPCATIDQLAAQQEAVDRRLLAVCADLSSEKVATVINICREDRVQRERMEDVLTHLFQHQTHHRGQVHAILAGTSVKPPQLDEFIVADDSRFRKSEMTAFAWTEEDLMS